MQKSLLLDADPGHDDALAMMLLAGNAGIDLRQLTTVSGNALIEKTTINARAVLRLIEREDIPVFFWRGQTASHSSKSG